MTHRKINLTHRIVQTKMFFFEFTEVEDGYSIRLKGVPNNGTIDIPSKHNGRDVVEVGDPKNSFLSSLKNLSIPDSITKIGGNVFYYCNLLKDVYYEGTIEDWCKINFEDTDYYISWSNPMYYASHFYIKNNNNEYEEVTEIVIPDTITSIGNYQFCGFNNVTKITIPNSVQTIGYATFNDCSSLIDVYYEGTLEDWCKISFESGSSNPMRYASHFYIKNGNEYEEVTEIVIPDTITSIGKCQFYGFNNVTKITIPNSVTSIGLSAFSHCSSLASVKFESGSKLSSIEDTAFIECSSLTSIVIPNSVTSIGEGAFYGCNSITSVTFERDSELTFIGNGAFSNCSSLTDVYYEGTIEDWCKIRFNNVDANPMFYASHFYIKNSNNEYEEVTEIVIPETITTIGDYQFHGFTNVTKITIPDSVTSIGSYAFAWCKSLRYNVYENCCYLGNEENPYLVLMGPKDISIATVKISEYARFIMNCAFLNCRSLTSIVIPSSIKNIGDNAFCDCSSLVSIVIPDSVVSIGSGVFYGCSSLESITLPFVGETINGVSHTYLGYLFGAVFHYQNSEFVPTSLKEVILTGGTSIGDYAFSGCSSLTSIVIPDSIVSVGYSAFYGCRSVQYNEYGNCYYLGNEENPYLVLAKAKDTSITTATISENTRIIMESAFSNCSKLTTIVIPDSCCNIGYSAFAKCSSLASIVIPDSVIGIGKYAFRDCSSLTIYCEASSQPREWDSTWNYSNRPVYWSEEWYYVDGVPTIK